MMQTQTCSKKNGEGQKTLGCKQSTNDYGCRIGGWGSIGGGCAVLLALFQTLQSATVQWSYTDITHVSTT